MPTLFRAAVLFVSCALVACSSGSREPASPASFEAWTPPGTEMVFAPKVAPAPPATAAVHVPAPQALHPNHHVARSIIHSGRYAP
jgi:hypothetical protein